MNTEWYAVDRDAHVGVFWSAEGGAVPIGAGTSNHAPRSLVDSLPEAPFRLLDWLGDDGQERHVDLPDELDEPLGRVLMFLAGLDPVAEEVEREEAHFAAAEEGVAVLVQDLPAAVAWRLHRAGACLGCFPWPADVECHGLDEDRPRRAGLFRYVHDPDSTIASAYFRGRPPDRPVRVDRLPPDLRDHVGRFRFEGVRFGDAAKIQPLGMVPCSAWGHAYIDLDGETLRPIPGREAEFDARR